MRYIYLVLAIVVLSGCAVAPKEQCHKDCTEYVNKLNENLGAEMHQCLLKCGE